MSTSNETMENLCAPLEEPSEEQVLINSENAVNEVVNNIISNIENKLKKIGVKIKRLK